MGLSANQNNVNLKSVLPHSIQQCFYQKNGEWFIQMKQESIGPFADKSDAQMALMYYSVRTLWPDDKQLRCFARQGL